MKQKVIVAGFGFLIILALIIISTNGEKINTVAKTEAIFRAGIELKSNYFCENISKKEQAKIAKGSGFKNNPAKCREALERARAYGEINDIAPKILATAMIPLKNDDKTTVFLASECSIYKGRVQANEKIFKITADNKSGEIDAIESPTKKEVDQNRDKLSQRLTSKDPLCQDKKRPV